MASRASRSTRQGGAAARPSPAGDALSVLAVQVLRLSGILIDAGDRLAGPMGQTIARALGQARQSVQRVADLLAESGLAVYRDNPDDRRAMLLDLTARGRSTLRAIQAAQRGWADALGAEIGERDLRAASATLARVADTLARRRDEER